jgi:hypothetical protein
VGNELDGFSCGSKEVLVCVASVNNVTGHSRSEENLLLEPLLLPFKDEAQTAIFKDPVRTAL